MAACNSLSELCKEVNELFDRQVTEEEIVPYPQFQNVLADLCCKAKTERVELDQEVQQAKHTYEEGRVKYLKASVMVSALKEVVEENKDNALESERVPCKCDPSQNSDVSAATYLTMVLTNDQFPSKDNKEKLSHFGIKQEHLQQHFQPLRKEMFVEYFLVPELNKKLHEMCQSVLSYHGQECTENLVLSKISQLPAVLAEETRESELNRESLEKETLAYNRALEEYFEYLLTAIQLLQNKLKFKKSDQEFWIITKDFYSLKCDALMLKLKLLMLEVMNETYDKESVLALKTIKKTMDEEESKVKSELLEKSALLEEYECLGPQFASLAKEFSKLCLQVENEKWTLETLEKEDKS